MLPRDLPAVRINGDTILLRDVIQRARANGHLQFLNDAIAAAIVADAARQLNISITKEEAQKAANDFREKHRLLKAQDMLQWLEVRGLTVSDWQNSLEEEVLAEKFKSVRFDSKIDSYFAEHKLQFDQATIGRICASSENLAGELALQIREEGAVFEDVARKYSIDAKTKDTGGYVGRVTRRDLGAEASSAVFGGKAGSVQGPFKVGKEYRVFRVIALHPAILDDETRKVIKERMFREWLEDTKSKSNIEIPLFDLEPAVVEV